ncbi:MAG TPA: hypothetical protein VJX67_16630 [Blastocatellia bacterium]|nr:hypothetical protein [Blastocatellia bacterium]
MTDKVQATLTISTQSQTIKWSPKDPHLPKPQPPRIAIDGKVIVPAQGPASPTGFQMVIMDATQNPSNPSAILLNRYITVFSASEDSNNWSSTYDGVYYRIRENVLTTGDINEQILILASFGLDRGMAPDPDALEMFLAYGAGAQLQLWETTADIGSQVGDPTSWTTFPTNYILVGGSSLGYKQGTEVYATSNQAPVNSTVTVPLGELRQKPGVREAAG